MLFIIRLCCLLVLSQALFAEDTKEFKRYLEHSTWVVPPSTLLAYYYDNGSTSPVADQTVWTINDYNEGYFFGESYTSINATPSSKMILVGSITPSGDVFITFFSTTGNLLTTDFVNGIGKFHKNDGKPYFVMQMNSAQNGNSGLSHWSYMTGVTPEDLFYKHLPGVNMSVPEFIDQF